MNATVSLEHSMAGDSSVTSSSSIGAQLNHAQNPGPSRLNSTSQADNVPVFSPSDNEEAR